MRTSSTFTFLLLCAVCFGEWYDSPRSYDGTGNNDNDWGEADTIFPRLDDVNMATAYSPRYLADGNTPNSTLPSGNTWYSARNISNILLGSEEDPINSTAGIAYLHMFWGQFLDHDITLTNGAAAVWDIEIPSDDEYYSSLGNMSFTRSGAYYTDSVRYQQNGNTHFIDASTIYGSSSSIRDLLRNGTSCYIYLVENTITNGGYTEYLLPRQGEVTVNGSIADYVGNDGNNNGKVNQSTLYLSGDVRCNENPILTSFHTLFAREHNRLCDTLESLGDDDRDFENARRWVNGFLAQITLNEYLAATVGNTLTPWTAYDSSVDPRIASYFSTSGFRYGHTEILDRIPVYNSETGAFIEAVPLESSFFNPEVVQTYGVDNLLAGLVRVPQNEIDPFYSKTPRNFLFGGEIGSDQIGTDLGARNIQRGRDHGLPLYNEMRVILGLTAKSAFSDVTSSESLQALLEEAYPGGPSDMDTYTGGLSEDKDTPSDLGELLTTVVTETYQRLRDGDKYYYENTAYSGFNDTEVATIAGTKLKDIILRNTRATSYPCSPFYQVEEYSAFNCGSTSDNKASESTSYTWAVGNFTINLKITDNGDETLTFSFTIDTTTRWVAIGFPKSYDNPTMLNSDVGMTTKDSTTGDYAIYDYYVGSLFRHASCPSGVCSDTGLDAGGTQDLTYTSVEIIGDSLSVNFTRKRNSTDVRDNNLAASGEKQALLVATGPLSSGQVILYHSANKIIKQIVMPGAAASTPTPVTSDASLFAWNALFFVVCFLAQFVLF